MLVSNIKEMTEIGIVHLFDLEDGLLRILMQFEVSKYLVCYTAVFSVVTQHLNRHTHIKKRKNIKKTNKYKKHTATNRSDLIAK